MNMGGRTATQRDINLMQSRPQHALAMRLPRKPYPGNLVFERMIDPESAA
jgi:hypothetical protein